MALFRKRKDTPPPPPPEWAPFADTGDWLEFERLVKAGADARGWTGDVREGILTDGSNKFGLSNIAQICGNASREEWPALLEEHFDVLGTFGEREEFDNRGEARLALRVRLLDDDFLASLEHQPLARRVAEDLQLVVAFDLPDSVMVSPREETLQWGPEDELFDLALEQTKAEPGLDVERMDLPFNEAGDSVTIFALYGDSFFTATHALWADELDPPASEYGTLVAVPTRHTLFAHVIRDESAIGAVQHLMQLAHDFAARGPGSISEHLYWIRDGVWERQLASVEEDRHVFTPGPGFTAMLNELV